MGYGWPKSRHLPITLLQIFTIICQVLTEGPRFAEPIPNVTVALGRDANLPCVVENLGTYKVAWIHIDRQMILTIHRHVISRLPRFSVSHDNAMTWLLHVSQVQQEDRGYYMCQVNTNPMISQVGYLQVVVPPNILDNESTQSTVAVRENQNISLTCKADGFPQPKIMWRREDGQTISVDKRKKVTVHEGEQLSLARISRTEMGAYLCIATNGVPPSVSKRIIVDVEFSPMIWVPNQLVGAPAGTDVTVDCHTEAHPRAISYWVYDNVMVLPTKKYGIITTENSYRAHMKLTVRNLQPGDFGNYRCISKNSLGETEGSIRLYEIPMPSSSPKATEMKSNANKEGRRNATRSLSGVIRDTEVQGVGAGGPVSENGEYAVTLPPSIQDNPRQTPHYNNDHIFQPNETSGGSYVSVRWRTSSYILLIVVLHIKIHI